MNASSISLSNIINNLEELFSEYPTVAANEVCKKKEKSSYGEIKFESFIIYSKTYVYLLKYNKAYLLYYEDVY